MNGQIIQQTVYDSVLDYNHGCGRNIQRLLVNGLAITHDQKTLFIFPWEDDDPTIKVLSEVEVPDEVVKAARQFLFLKGQIEGFVVPVLKESDDA